MGGFFSRLFGGKNTKPEPVNLLRQSTSPPPRPLAPAPAPAPAPGQEIRLFLSEDLEVSGESYHREGVGKIFLGLGRDEGGVTMQTAHLIPEPNNPYDPNAVRVVILGEQVGHVPQEYSAYMSQLCASVGLGNVGSAPARIWARNDDGTWRSRVTLMFTGGSESEKDYAAERREADAYYAQQEAERTHKAAEREAREAHKEARRLAGAIDGEYWPLLKPSIAELKRQKRNDEALTILEQCVDAAERESVVTGTVPDPWPSEQMSVVLRRLNDYSRELLFLERYVAACGENEKPDSITMRLNRSRLAAENSTSS